MLLLSGVKFSLSLPKEPFSLSTKANGNDMAVPNMPRNS